MTSTTCKNTYIADNGEVLTRHSGVSIDWDLVNATVKQANANRTRVQCPPSIWPGDEGEMRTVLITGAAGGIGRELMKAFEANGDNVIGFDLVADDVAGITAVDILDDTFISSHVPPAGVDVLINNAGITRDRQMINMSRDDLDDVMALNFRAAWVLSKAVLPHMIDQNKGRIINISSVNAFGAFGQTNYAASKAALLGMSKSLALEVATKGITVNSICPGYASTPMISSIRPEILKKIVDKIPQGVLVSPADIAAAAVFLASDAAKSITGTELHMNGGMRL